ncbi:septum formation initiator [Campylobacter gastrosuis]|uniref:Septum formation initiator n=1 Tax=Campylobacter gastrosuis TaxID=2974576 RepID=A0ABT7HPE4_9BACT|nr:septum formation initiator [Campylobacter gastrosuis]MDL0088792.1 septum formation initiator [Campylobacter gastrosuis]
MSEILKEYDKSQKAKKSYSFMQILRYVGIVACVVGFGIYVGNMMFGKRSLDVMLSLQSKKERLSEDVEYLKKQNAMLLKEYFELKELEPENNKK